jgi:hypothetical protein
MSYFRDAFIEYLEDNLPENFDDLPKVEQDKITTKMESEFMEHCVAKAESREDR